MRDERQMTDSCVYLADCYEDLFFGNVNKRYRSMTAAQLKSRMERLNAQTLEEVAKPNELSDIHAMTAKACSYVMGAGSGPGPKSSRGSGMSCGSGWWISAISWRQRTWNFSRP